VTSLRDPFAFVATTIPRRATAMRCSSSAPIKWSMTSSECLASLSSTTSAWRSQCSLGCRNGEWEEMASGMRMGERVEAGRGGEAYGAFRGKG